MNMAGQQIFLSIVIPALNEERRLPAALDSIVSFLAKSKNLLPAEIVIVDDGSSIEIASVLKPDFAHRMVDLRILRHGKTRGKGAAIRTGFASAMGKNVLITDADLSAPIDQFHVLLRKQKVNNVVIGSRAVDRSLIVNPQPAHRDFMGRCFNVLVRTLVLPGIHDSQCGFKLFPGGLARELARVQRLDGFAFDVEYLYLSRKWGFDIAEVGVRWAHVEASRVLPGRHSLQMFRDMLRLWGWKMSRSYPSYRETE